MRLYGKPCNSCNSIFSTSLNKMDRGNGTSGIKILNSTNNEIISIPIYSSQMLGGVENKKTKRGRFVDVRTCSRDVYKRDKTAIIIY